MGDMASRMFLAEAMDLHKRAVREAYRRVLRLRSDLENATDEHESAIKAEERFKEYVKTTFDGATHEH